MNQESSSHTVHWKFVDSFETYLIKVLYQANSEIPTCFITVICICFQNYKIAVIEEHFK